MEQIDAVVIGAGVVGLAIARELALSGGSVLIVEQGERFGAETSARNSEVIHAGIYYAQGSLKARLCRDGRDRLYAYLSERALPHRRCGKLVVANSAQEEQALRGLQQVIGRGARRQLLAGLELAAQVEGRLLAAQRPIWLLDEPTSSMDQMLERHVFQTLRAEIQAAVDDANAAVSIA